MAVGMDGTTSPVWVKAWGHDVAGLRSPTVFSASGLLRWVCGGGLQLSRSALQA